MKQNNIDNKKFVREIKIEDAANNIINNVIKSDKNFKGNSEGFISGIQGDKEKVKSVHEEKSSSYPNLSEERKKYLIGLIEKLESSYSNDNADKSISSEERSRRTFRNKISYALVIIL